MGGVNLIESNWFLPRTPQPLIRIVAQRSKTQLSMLDLDLKLLSVATIIMHIWPDTYPRHDLMNGITATNEQTAVPAKDYTSPILLSPSPITPEASQLEMPLWELPSMVFRFTTIQVEEN